MALGEVQHCSIKVVAEIGNKMNPVEIRSRKIYHVFHYVVGFFVCPKRSLSVLSHMHGYANMRIWEL